MKKNISIVVDSTIQYLEKMSLQGIRGSTV